MTIRLISTATQPSVLVAAHQVDRAEVGRPLAAVEPQPGLERLRQRRERFLQVALDAVLLERRGLAHLVLDVGEHFVQADLEAILAAAGALADDEHAVAFLDHGRRRHPVERPVAAGVGVHEHRAVGLDHHQARRLRQVRGQAAGVGDLAAGDKQAHCANLLSFSDEEAFRLEKADLVAGRAFEREVGEDLAHHGRELEAVTGAGRGDGNVRCVGVEAEHEMAVRGVREQAGLALDELPSLRESPPAKSRSTSMSSACMRPSFRRPPAAMP